MSAANKIRMLTASRRVVELCLRTGYHTLHRQPVHCVATAASVQPQYQPDIETLRLSIPDARNSKFDSSTSNANNESNNHNSIPVDFLETDIPSQYKKNASEAANSPKKQNTPKTEDHIRKMSTAVPQSKLKENDSPPEAPQFCCMSGCPNCVWIEYATELANYYQDGGKVALQEIEKLDDPGLKMFLKLQLDLDTD